ncbi:putative conserved protein YkwD, contains CAP (CSP/antigen 5/PR1) domain [Metschnikowia aff. pulcherrima]|uniref:Putative conserved protein YkwD, contains CAP (CSP/antigen 5/PR1) domain n=1 Tax=Metschnikowia aff. pulcherrima TaxID=2163413 RepID=A0A4P6XU11_9ASCO|nr:putative conserved protein YkwD, contains CAP (CSP/antigen 5/PR1) domain [Metschnikowia aff. pulcherrima]
MKLHTLFGALTLASSVIAKTEYVTRYHYVTVDGNGEVIASNIVLSGAAQATNGARILGSDKKEKSSEATTLTTIRTSSASLMEFKTDDESVVSVSEPTIEATSQIRSEATGNESTTSTNTAADQTAPESSSSATSAPSSESDSGIYSEISSSGVDASFAKAILDAHNTKRKAHSAPNLSWSSTLFSYAQNYADSYACGASLVHSGGKYGENLASGYSSGVAALEAWYSEGDNYDYSAANVFDHFTQVIWKSTTALGCAYKSCGGGLYIICSYDPAGNFGGEGPQNLSAN